MTSGSTGRPKCVVQSEDAIRYASTSTIDAVGLRPGEAIGAFVPLSSVAAFCFGMYLPALLGGPMVAIGKWSPEAALRAAREHSIAWTMLVPTMALQLSVAPNSEAALDTMRAMTVGARADERASPRQGRTVVAHHVPSSVRNVGVLGPYDARSRRPGVDPPGRDGRPFPGTTVRAVDSDGRPLSADDIGAAQVKGPSWSSGTPEPEPRCHPS